MPMPHDVSSSPSKPSTQSVSSNRELSWRVASNLWISFRYAWGGIHYAFRTQRNFRLHVLIGSTAIALALLLKLAAVEVAVIALTSGAVLAMELLNTAIESVVDLTVKQTYHDLAKIAKDCAAAAVLVFAIAAVVVAGLLLLPPLVTLIQEYWSQYAAE